jgi:hypothetical protein
MLQILPAQMSEANGLQTMCHHGCKRQEPAFQRHIRRRHGPMCGCLDRVAMRLTPTGIAFLSAAMNSSRSVCDGKELQVSLSVAIDRLDLESSSLKTKALVQNSQNAAICGEGIAFANP